MTLMEEEHDNFTDPDWIKDYCKARLPAKYRTNLFVIDRMEAMVKSLMFQKNKILFNTTSLFPSIISKIQAHGK